MNLLPIDLFDNIVLIGGCIMEQVKLFFKRVFEKMYFCLFAIFFIATYPWYKKAKNEMDNISDDEIFREEVLWKK